MNAKHRAVMKQAVDALQFARNQIVHLADAANLRPLVREIGDSIEALRAALAEAVQEPVSNTTTLRAMLECCLSWEPNACVLGNVTARQAVIALRAALAEPEQEPVAPARRPLTDAEFNALCEANSFGAVARGECPWIPRRMVKALVDAAIAKAGGNDE